MPINNYNRNEGDNLHFDEDELSYMSPFFSKSSTCLFSQLLLSQWKSIPVIGALIHCIDRMFNALQWGQSIG